MSEPITISNATVSDSNPDQNLIYSQKDLWYFRTSDGREVGPFRYRSEAETGLHLILTSTENTH